MWRCAEAFVASERHASDDIAALTKAGLLTRGVTGHETHHVLPSAGKVRDHKLPISFIPSGAETTGMTLSPAGDT